MGDLVEDRGLAPESLHESRALPIDEALLVVEDRARVLHPAERERWREDDVELLERKRSIEIVLQPIQRTAVVVENRIPFDFGLPRRPHIQGDGSRSRRAGNTRPRPGGKRDEIGTYALSPCEMRC